MRSLLIQIDSGETTCAADTGKFCEHFRMRLDGSRPYCRLFDRHLKEDKPDGWLQRCPECIQAEEETHREIVNQMEGRVEAPRDMLSTPATEIDAEALKCRIREMCPRKSTLIRGIGIE